MPNRPSRRSLVRWNDDHDKELLLWIVYCCNEQGIKIPFARIAQCMGASFTEGACIQHLAKIRNKMDEAGLHVPPTQKRGTVTRTASSIYRPKPKGINAPVPRVRPDIPPPPRDHGFYDDDEEEEGEEDLDGNAEPPKTKTARKTTRRQASVHTAPTAIKDNSEDDEALPALYDSDNEYGAKRSNLSPSKKKQNTSPSKTQMTLNFAEQPTSMQGGCGLGTVAFDGSQNSSTFMQIDQDTLALKYESLEDSMANFVTVPAQPRGTRRKSSAITADDEDGEYEPEPKGKGRAKKARGGRTNKKQKADDKSKDALEKETALATLTGYQDASIYDADRAAMPPPNLPLLNTNLGVEWNHNFVNNPFATSSTQFPQYNGPNMVDGNWNDYSPNTNNFHNQGFFPTVGNHIMNSYQSPGCGYVHSGMASANSTPDSRHHSFASATSNSTVESQPASWNQPLRSPSFPNPQEASKVMHAFNNTTGADALTRINIFRPPPIQQQDLAAAYGFDMVEPQIETGQQTSVASDGMDGLFVGEPEVPDPDLNFSDYLADPQYQV